MRKALMGLILAATVMTPVAADAQRWRGGDGDGQRAQNQNGDEGRAEQRQQQRQQQREARQAQPQPQAEAQQQAPAQVVQRERAGNRGGGDGNRGWRGGSDNGGNRDNWRRGDANNGADRGAGWQGRQRNTQPSIYPQAWQGNPNDPRLRRYQETERRNQQRYGDGRRGDDRRNWRNDRNDRRDWRGDRGGRRNDWDRGWRNDRRYDWQRWRYSNRNIFNIGPYYSPYGGYGYDRFSIGFFLEPLFYNQRYWIGDPWQYRLPAAYPGTQWVRYYNDVLLVDVYSGEVLDVIYDFFY